ncbi:hypothetical protein [Edaphovirga cremea]|uniref:hypothetical protein n=1 Tax=Edaphovirga cremea TaxID=2267246 RepID=UPI003988DE8C
MKTTSMGNPRGGYFSAPKIESDSKENLFTNLPCYFRSNYQYRETGNIGAPAATPYHDKHISMEAINAQY